MDTLTLDAHGLRARLRADDEGGCRCTLTDTRTGHTWPTVPVLAVEAYDRTLQRPTAPTRRTCARWSASATRCT